jgi:hypothetical protein
MYFPRDDCPIFLMTDACDYGIGAYCYQLVDNNEQSVALVSKSLNDTQFKWSILQKEAYAIFYALKQELSLEIVIWYSVITEGMCFENR